MRRDWRSREPDPPDLVGGSTSTNEDLLMASTRAHEFAIAAEVRSAPVRNIFNLLILCTITVGVLLNVPHNSPKGISLYNNVAATLERTVEKAPVVLPVVVPVMPAMPAIAQPISEFRKEAAMTPSMLMKRWDPVIAEAAKQFSIPAEWIRAVMRRESGGRTTVHGRPIRSKAGAVGLMQLMPATYAELRAKHALGADPANPHDNVMAGAAYLRLLHRKYGFPAMFAAYNAGPGYYEDHLQGTRALPAETQAYVAGITASVGRRAGAGAS
jgi:membrane-bound lytic murein transglycosylase B